MYWFFAKICIGKNRSTRMSRSSACARALSRLAPVNLATLCGHDPHYCLVVSVTYVITQISAFLCLCITNVLVRQITMKWQPNRATRKLLDVFFWKLTIKERSRPYTYFHEKMDCMFMTYVREITNKRIQVQRMVKIWLLVFIISNEFNERIRLQ